jgi:hypothetical protein
MILESDWVKGPRADVAEISEAMKQGREIMAAELDPFSFPMGRSVLAVTISQGGHGRQS